MKKIYHLAVLALGLLTLASCGDDDYTEKVNSIQVEQSETLIASTGGSVNITLTGEGLTAASAADWLTATISGNVLTASAGANPTRESRASHIDVTAANGDTYRVSIVQSGGILSLDSDEIEATDQEGAYSVSIGKVDGGISVKSLSDWVTAKVDTESNTVKVDVASNDYDVTRQGKILVTCGLLTDTLYVNQDAMTFNLSTNLASFLTKDAGEQTIEVEHSKPYTVTCNADWATTSMDGDVITVSATASTAERRYGTATVTSGKVSKTIYLGQLDFASQFTGTYNLVYFNTSDVAWYYTPAKVTDESITIAPFGDGYEFVMPIYVNPLTNTVTTAKSGTYLGEYLYKEAIYYVYLAWGSGSRWSTVSVKNASMEGIVYVNKTQTGKLVTCINWQGTYRYMGTTYDIDTWVFQAMKGKAFNATNNAGYLIRLADPYLVSESQSEETRSAAKNGCLKELPNGEWARPAELKAILRPQE